MLPFHALRQRSFIASTMETITASPNSPLSHSTVTSPDSTRDFGSDFVSMYRSIFPPKFTLPSSLSLTPSTLSFSDDDDDRDRDTMPHHSFSQAQLVLEYQDLRDHCDLITARLRDLADEIDSLRRDNAHLRSSNTDLVKLLSSQTAFQTFLLSSAAYLNSPSFLDEFQRLGLGSPLGPRDGVSAASDDASDFSPTSVIEHQRNNDNRFDVARNGNADRISLPKSISVRSSGFQKDNPIRSSTRPPVPSRLVSAPQRVHVASTGGAAAAALEMKVYNQGMVKTELCNKWQQSGACPYGDNCQFAHGIKELRPVIRHPRYKTEVCRMVLAGGACPYGHRCHFRHSLTEQESLQLAMKDSL